MAEGKRNANIELLRIVAMAMIVVLHFLKYSGYLPDAEMAETGRSLGSLNYVAVFLESFCIVAVNAYILVSGYFGQESKWNLSKIVRFLCRIWFYTLLIPAVLYCLGVPVLPQTEGIYGLVKYMLPISTSHYWFATCYFQLLLVMPLLGKAVKTMDRKQFTTVLGCLLLVFCGLKSLCPLELVTDQYGYDFIWFVCLYLTGAWLRGLDGKPLDLLKKKAGLLYGGSCMVIAGVVVAFYYITMHFSGAGYYFSVPWHYNYLFCLTGAIGFFFLFMNITIKEGNIAEGIRRVAGCSFGVYLFHEQLDIKGICFTFLKNSINPMQREGLFVMIAELLVCLVVIYTAGLCIDFIRTELAAFVAKQIKR